MKPAQTALDFNPPKPESAGQSYYAVGGWPDYSQWINPYEVPLCSHKHEPIDPKQMRELIKKCMIPAYFRRHCLTADWKGHEAGAECIVYGTVQEGGKFDLWVMR